ncbi:MAG: PAS domain-containing protein, partial [Vicinamibacterales bacterium]
MPNASDDYRFVINQIADAVLACRGHVIAMANERAAALLGTRVDRLEGQPALAPFTAASQPIVRARLDGMDRPHDPSRLDVQVQTPEGVRDVELTTAWLPAERLTHLALRDVTDARRLRENEERLRLAFAGAQEGVWDWDLETGAVRYSDRWKAMLGY